MCITELSPPFNTSCTNVAAEHMNSAAADTRVTVEAEVSLFSSRLPNTKRIIPFINNHIPAAIINAPRDKNDSNHNTAQSTSSTMKIP